jgi:hypothetical protein
MRPHTPVLRLPRPTTFATVVVLAASAAAIASTSLSGFFLLDQVEGGFVDTTSPSGFVDTSGAPDAAGDGVSPSGYGVTMGTFDPIITTPPATIGDWTTIAE